MRVYAARPDTPARPESVYTRPGRGGWYIRPVARTQIGLKLDDQLLARIDQARGDTPRTAFIERALELALGAVAEPVAELHEPERPPRGHQPKPGRLALVCTVCNRRQFGDPGWRCPEHPGQTVVQRNRPYLGQPVPNRDIGLPVVDPMPPSLH